MAIGDRFIFHGPSGILTVRIEHETECFDGLMLIHGTVLQGTEHYCNDDGSYHASRDLTGAFVGAWVTKDDLARGTNEPAVRPTKCRDRH